MPRAVVRFTIRYENTRWGENVHLVGAEPEMGAWDIANSIMLTAKDGIWSALVSIELGRKYEYKYVFRAHGFDRWEQTPHFRSFEIPAGEICEVHDIWHDDASFIQDISSSSLIRDVCMHRENPKKLPPLTMPEAGKVTVVFEANVPLVSPQESVRLIGASKKTPFWRVADSQVLTDADCPTFRIAREFAVEEFPVKYKFVLSHDLGWECENIEVGSDNICAAPFPFEHTTVWTLPKTGKPTEIPVDEAIDEGLLKELPTAGAQIIYSESPSFRYPNPAKFRAAGVVLPVFSLRTKQSLGIGEFTDLVLLARWCQRAGLRLIQLLPITDTTVNDIHWMDSYPYSSTSSFALHPIYINIDSLAPLPADIQKALPKERERLNQAKVDYETTLRLKMDYLTRIYEHHMSQGLIAGDKEFAQFQKEAAYWLPSYAVFKALAKKNKSTDWQSWPAEDTESDRVETLVTEMTQRKHPLYKDVHFTMWVQFHLDRQLRAASQKCTTEFQVGLKGDIPIGVDPRSADTWYFRRYFKMDTQAGAPPDMFSAHGQNWEFPTYNWETILQDKFEWWANRLKVMGRSMHAFRIDHILGFFRIWEIPRSVMSGLHARFFPGQMISDHELRRRGLNNAFDRLTKPIITKELVHRLFGAEADDIIATYLDAAPAGSDSDYVIKSEFKTERELADAVKAARGITPLSSSDELKAVDAYLKKFYGLTNSVCLYKFDQGYAPRFDIASTESFKRLGGDWQAALAQLSKEYFYEWHQPIFEHAARLKFPQMKAASRMLICGEDLGLLSPIIPKVMQDYHIIGLRVQRMPADPKEDYYHPNNYAYDMVATTSTHDMPPLRAWWQITPLDRPDLSSFYATEEARKQCQIRDSFWYNTLCQTSPRPQSLDCAQLERIVDMHMYSPAMLCVLPYQDLVAIIEDKEVYHENPWDEVINNPDNRRHYWQYRMPCLIERLLEKTELAERIHGKVLDSGRLRAH